MRGGRAAECRRTSCVQIFMDVIDAILQKTLYPRSIGLVLEKKNDIIAEIRKNIAILRRMNELVANVERRIYFPMVLFLYV